MEYKVNFTWDEEARVWIAQNDDVLGLVLESGSLDALIERVRFVKHGKGDHDIYYSPITNRNITVDSKIKSRHTANAIMKQKWD